MAKIVNGVDSGRVSFFQVKQCGFYKYKDRKAVYVEGGLDTVVQCFCDWVAGQKFNETIPWDVSSHPKRTQIYCKDFAHDPVTGETILVLWKRFGDDSGKVSGIKASAKVGGSSSDSVKIDAEAPDGEPAILGQPMYYWFVPEQNVMATINFSHSSAATKDVCDYIKRSISYRATHPRKKKVERVNGAGETVKMDKFLTQDGHSSMHLKFEANTRELKSEGANAKDLSKRITHLVIRDTVSAEVLQSDGDPLFRLVFREKKKKVLKRIEIIEETTLSPSEVKKILEAHKSEQVEGQVWNDIGFKEEGSGSVRWFSSYTSSENIDLRKLPESKNYHTAKSLLQRIGLVRDDLLSQLSDGGSTRAAGE